MIDPLWALGLTGFGLLARPLLDRVFSGPVWSASLVKWGHVVDDGVVFCMDGSLVAGFVLRPPDRDAVDEMTLQNIGRHTAAALVRFSGWTVHFDLVRVPRVLPTGTSHYPTEGMEFLASCRARSMQAEEPFRSEIFMTLVSPTRGAVQRKMSDWFIANPERVSDSLVEALEEARIRLADLEGRLRTSVGSRRLGSDELLSFLRFCATGLRGRVEAPARPPFYVGHRLLDQDLLGGLRQQVGLLHCATVAVTGFPREVAVGGTGFLETVGFPLRSSLQVKIWDAPTAEKNLERCLQVYAANLKGLKALVAKQMRGSEDSDSQLADELFRAKGPEMAAREVREAIAEVNQGTDWYGSAAWNLVVWATNAVELSERVKSLTALCHQHGFETRVEGVNGMAAFHGTWPGHGGSNERKVMLSGCVAMALAPLTSHWLGLPFNPSNLFPKGSPRLLTARMGESNRFDLNLHVDDVGHTLIVGKTSSGKSVLVATLAASFLQYERSRVVILDVGGSAEPFCRLAGGSYHTLSVEHPEYHLQPLEGIETEEGRRSALEWLEMTCQLNGVAVTAEDREVLRTQLERLGRRSSLSAMRYLVAALPQGAIRTCLAEYSQGGTYGALFDGEERHQIGRVAVFEIGKLLGFRREVAIPAALLIVRFVRRQLDGAPLLLVFEEAHRLFGDPVLEDFSAELLRELRKENGAMAFVTQTAADLTEAGVPAVFYDSFATQFHVPNANAESTVMDAAYDALRVDARTRARIAGGQPRKEYLVIQGEQQAMLDLGLSTEELRLLSVPKTEIPRLRRAVSADPAGYFRDWVL